MNIGVVVNGGNLDVLPPQAFKPHNACFLDFMYALAAALRDLGHDTDVYRALLQGRMVRFGCNEPGSHARADDIIYSAEPIALADDPIKFLPDGDRSRVIWDYSAANVARWRELGFERAVHCPLGYHPSMETIAPAERETIDVLHYGALSERRIKILRALRDAGLRVTQLHGDYGSVRDRIIARSKVVLNMHHGDRGIFEIFRCSHLFANRRFVVTEGGGVDTELEWLAQSCAVRVPYDHLVSVCLGYVRDAPELRQPLAERGYNEFKKLSLVESVRRALAESRLDG